jgi:myo-inositol-1(or 4)-monophosphatase
VTPTGGFRPESVAALEAVERALELARSRAGATDVSSKGVRDAVTATDVAVEDVVRHAVSEALGIAMIGEERGGEASADGAPYWLVDPICGTRNFASEIPLCCVNLALVEEGAVTVSVVGDPASGVIAVAERGRGAWAPNTESLGKLATSGESEVVIVEDGHAKGARREHAARFAAAATRSDRWDLRMLGTTLSLFYVATGRTAAYVLFFATSIHTAAGSLLAAEAGATVSDIDGEPWTIRSDSIVASADPVLHGDLLDLVAGARG